MVKLLVGGVVLPLDTAASDNKTITTNAAQARFMNFSSDEPAVRMIRLLAQAKGFQVDAKYAA